MIGRVARLVLGLAAAAALFLAAGELLARALDVVDRLNGYNRFIYQRGPSVDLPYLLRPGVETTVFGTPVRVNRLGLRGPEAEPRPRPGVHRVLVLGDSVVFGQGVAEDQALPAELGRRLNAANVGEYEVLNGGVQGYDAVAEARLLEAMGLALGPEIVVVSTSLNDYDVAPQYSPLGILTRKDLDRRAPDLVDRSEFLTLLRWLTGGVRGSLYQVMARVPPPGATTEGAHGLAQLVEQTHLRFYHDPDPADWNRLRAAYSDFVRLAAAHRLRLLVAIFPESYQVGRPDPDLTPQRRLLALCAEVRLRCLDLQPVLAAAGGELFLDPQHPNARGHAAAAEAIAAALLGH
jgi:lysophospholipase L1-like esterase